MVDAVVTWVDGADPEHARKRAAHAEEAGRPDIEARANLDTRFHNLDELRVCLFSIRRFAPWIERVFLVTDEQRPAWLDVGLQKRLRVTVVDHSVVFRGHEDHLPTFSSLSIESVLHRIPGLGARFVYFNDDMFLTRPTTRGDFFEGDIPRIRGTFTLRPRWLRKPLLRAVVRRFSSDHDGMIALRLNGAGRLPRSVFRLVQLAHSPYPVLRDRMAMIMEQDGRIARNVRHRFRSHAQFNCFCLYATLEAAAGRARVVAPDGLYADPGAPKATRRLLSAWPAAEDGPHHLCLQSLEAFDEPDRSALMAVMEDLRKRCEEGSYAQQSVLRPSPSADDAGMSARPGLAASLSRTMP